MYFGIYLIGPACQYYPFLASLFKVFQYLFTFIPDVRFYLFILLPCPVYGFVYFVFGNTHRFEFFKKTSFEPSFIIHREKGVHKQNIFVLQYFHVISYDFGIRNHNRTVIVIIRFTLLFLFTCDRGIKNEL